MTKKHTTKNALEILARVTGDDDEIKELIAQETINSRIARIIYDARKEAGLTQTQLADMIGTKQSVIARLEDADYEGHSLSIVKHIGDALHQRINISFEPVNKQ